MNFLITGAARGIGRGITISLVRKGHRVFLLDINRNELEHTLSILSSIPSPAPDREPVFSSALCDLRKPQDIKAAVAQAASFFNGHLDVLVNDAGKTPNTWASGQTLKTVELDEWNDFLAVNLTAPFLITQACIPLLEKGQGRAMGGCIINISSTRARQSEPQSEGYAASKAGLLGLTHSSAITLGDMGIRVNAILPGWVEVTSDCKEADEKGVRWADGLTEEDHNWHPAGRVGKAEDIAKAVLYLAEADFVTAEELVVDGGVSKKMVYPE